jgi:hypothetical protein
MSLLKVEWAAAGHAEVYRQRDCAGIDNSEFTVAALMFST